MLNNKIPNVICKTKLLCYETILIMLKFSFYQITFFLMQIRGFILQQRYRKPTPLRILTPLPAFWRTRFSKYAKNFKNFMCDQDRKLLSDATPNVFHFKNGEKMKHPSPYCAERQAGLETSIQKLAKQFEPTQNQTLKTVFPLSFVH